MSESPTPQPLLALPGAPPIRATGSSLVVHEWTLSGPSYLHVHWADDEAWHVLAGTLIFRLQDGEVEAPAGSTVFVPAGTPHTYRVTPGSRYLIVLTPKLDRLITELLQLTDPAQIRSTLARYDTTIVD